MKEILTAVALALLAGSAFAQAGSVPDQTSGEALAAAPLAVPDNVMMLRLRDGSTRWGSIAEHDPDGVRFVLLAHGGGARVPWSLMDPNQEQELREKFGYVDVSSEELMIDAQSLQLLEGQEVVCVILAREGDNFRVKTGGNIQEIPKRRVRAVTGGLRVPALDIYSREEVYAQHLTQASPDDPAAQLELAKTCERILDFAHAVEHYAIVQALDPEFNKEEVGFALARASVKAEQQEQIDYLREVDHLRKRKKFDDALAMVVAFEETFPDSPLFLDARKKKERVLKARDAAIADLVRKRWHFWLGRLAREASRKDYVEAVTYVEEKLSDDIMEKVLEDVHKRMSDEVEEDHVRQFWIGRKKLRYQLASYGLGTWLLGEAGAHAGIDEEPEGKPESELDKQRAELNKKIERFLKNQSLARKAKSRQDQEGDFEAFWKSFPASGRAQWIRAYYAENSGDMEVKSPPRISNCPSCGGTGVTETIYIGGSGQGSGGSTLIRCATCQGIAIVRRIYYR